MKIAEVSTFVNYSVGKIMNDICRFINESTSDECRIFYGRDKNKMCQSAYYFGNKLLVYANAIISRMYDNDGFCCSFLTKKLIKCLDEYKPDIIHLHCLHGYVFNLKTLFKFIRKRRIKIIWTMHDTWAFTGHCCYFSLANCEKRKLLCRKCPQKKEYPKTYVSFAKRNFLKKKKQILQLDKKSLTIVSPSSWLDDLIKQSYLNIFNSMVIHNGINTTFFNTTHINEEEKKQKMLLGVASVWDERKGLNYFINLANKIDESWKVVIIGKLPKETKLPTRIVHIERTKNFF